MSAYVEMKLKGHVIGFRCIQRQFRSFPIEAHVCVIEKRLFDRLALNRSIW